MTNNNNSFNAANSFCSVQNSTSDHGFGLVSLVNCRAFIFMRLTPPPSPFNVTRNFEFCSSNWCSSGTGINTSNVAKTNGSNSMNQKRGAERLFQYFEAEDSDPEDYAR